MICNFINGFLSNINLNFRVSLDSVQFVVSFIKCFLYSLIYTLLFYNWFSKIIKWNVVYFISLGLIFSISGSKFEIIASIINFIGYSLGAAVYFLIDNHFKNKDSKKV